MTDPRQLFILMGFLAQALTWDSNWMLLLVLVLWAFAVTWAKGRWRATLTTEAIALVLGCVVSFVASKVLQRSAHFFIGDGLILLQLVRLTRPLTGREKLTALVIAAFHFGVLCTLAPNVRFVILFTGGLFVLPGALKETFVESTLQTISPAEFKYRLVPSPRVAFWLLLGSGFVFISAPRFTGSPLHLRDGMSEQGSLMDSVIDPRRTGRENSQEVLLQIDGDDVGYMRCFALPEFDGVKWSADRRSPLIRARFASEALMKEDARYKYRRVHVKNANYLGKIVPVDGVPVFMRQNFFYRPFLNGLTGAIEPHAMWSTGDNIYEYYIDSLAEPAPLQGNAQAKLLECPPQSARLTQWLAEVSAKGTNSLQKARLVELHLRNQFIYKMGSPELSRIDAIDDFIFNRKEGHCERFAAAMGLFLRMQGIPSRVVIGYVPTTRNLFTGRLQVRFRDAHSWTEGYFPEKGWVSFDATPGPPASGTGSDIRDMLEALDFAWYTHVVNFNGFAQRNFFANSANLLQQVPPTVWSGITWSIGILAIGAGTLHFFRKKKFKISLPFWRRRTSAARARHNYDQMLHALEARGIRKSGEVTPLEFQARLNREAADFQAETAPITDSFCRTFYGDEVLSSEEQRDVERALKALRKRCAETPVKTGSV